MTNFVAFKQFSKIGILAACLIFAGFAHAESPNDKSTDAKIATSAAPKVGLANGEKNWIIVEGVTGDDKVMTFAEVQIDGDGWLTMHPFGAGEPNGDKYVGAAYIKNGRNKMVDIEVHKGVKTADMFIATLHFDVNQNKVLDFIFTSDNGVMDEAIFEESTMVAHVVVVP